MTLETVKNMTVKVIYSQEFKIKEDLHNKIISQILEDCQEDGQDLKEYLTQMYKNDIYDILNVVNITIE